MDAFMRKAEVAANSARPWSSAGRHAARNRRRNKKKSQNAHNSHKKPISPDSACVVCGTEFQPSELSYRCPGNREHSQCLSCFGDFVRHCCNYYVNGKFPLCCPIPSCRARVDDLTLRTLLATPTLSSQNLWELYERSQLRAAFLQPQNDEVAVVCSRCNLYAEIYPANYKDRAHRLAKAFRTWRLEQDRLAQQPQQQPQEPQQPQDPRIPIAPPVVDFPSKDAVAAALKVASAAELIAKASHRAQVSSGPNAFAPGASSGDDVKVDVSQISVARFDPLKDPMIGITSQFFECKTAQCCASICLRCNQYVSQKDQLFHACSLDNINEIYGDVLDILAEASSRKCPSCGKVGRKDNNCCHITCEPPCNIRWCYVCGKVPEKNDFSSHNSNWTVLSPPERCPMYLQYAWGPTKNFNEANGYYNGDGGVALEVFHTTLQLPLMEAYRRELADEKLWQQMLDEKFPQGIFKPEHLKLIEDNRKNNEAYAIRKKEAEEQKRLEELKRAEEERKRREEEEKRWQAEQIEIQRYQNQPQVVEEKRSLLRELLARVSPASAPSNPNPNPIPPPRPLDPSSPAPGSDAPVAQPLLIGGSLLSNLR